MKLEVCHQRHFSFWMMLVLLFSVAPIFQQYAASPCSFAWSTKAFITGSCWQGPGLTPPAKGFSRTGSPSFVCSLSPARCFTERSWEHILDFLFLPALGHWGHKSRLIPILALPYQRWPEMKRQLLTLSQTSKDWETEVLFELLLVATSA